MSQRTRVLKIIFTILLVLLITFSVFSSLIKKQIDIDILNGEFLNYSIGDDIYITYEKLKVNDISKVESIMVSYNNFKGEYPSEFFYPNKSSTNILFPNSDTYHTWLIFFKSVYSIDTLSLVFKNNILYRIERIRKLIEVP